ncbi:MAG: hypothetical protein LQ342_005792 [Letrouitia transgressa]|nr:MAG: hypothetical protein LQ342_005792 [Letrouitia transgressa]
MPPKGRPRQPARRTTTADDVVQDTLDPGQPRDIPAFGEEGQDDSIDAGDPSLSNPQSQAVESSQPSSAQPASVSSLPPSRVERLASLNPQRGAIGSATSTNPSGAQTKRVRFQPKVAVRRSKEEREALEKAESERRQARLAASANFGAPASRETRGILKRRGGASHWRDSERLAGSGASGFLGGASSAEDRRLKFSASSRGRGRSSLLAGTSRDSTKPDGSEVQNERAPEKSKDKDGDIAVRGASARKTRTTVKKEDKKLAHVPSSDEEPFEVQPPGRRVNVEHINLVSDEDSTEEMKDGGKGKENEMSTKLPASSFMRPIRIDRHEHVERTIGVNTDASSLTSAELRRKAKARGDAEGSVFLPVNAELKNSKGEEDRSREEDQDVEFLRHEIREAGIYPDKDQNAGPQVKQEPTDAGEVMAINHSNELLATAITQEVLNQPSHPPREPTPTPKRPPKPRPRRQSRRKLNARKPVLQTDEDRKEWERYQEDMALICEELRRARSLSPPREPEPTTTTDEQDPKSSQEPKEKSKGKDKKDGLVYLFQLPPLMPELQQQLDKSKNSKAKEPAASQDKSEAVSAHGLKDRDPEPEAKLATESDPDIDPTIFTSAQSSRMPAGRVGEIMLDRDGFPSAVWGKTKMDVGRASAYGSLQEVIILRTEPREKGERVSEAMGETGRKVREAGSRKGGKPGAAGSEKKRKPGETGSGKKGKPGESESGKKGKPGEVGSGEKGKPSEAGSGKKGKSGEAGSRKKGKPGEAGSKKKGKLDEVRPGKREKAGEARSRKRVREGEVRSKKDGKVGEARAGKSGKAGEARPGKGEKAGDGRSGKRERRREARSEKGKGKRVRRGVPRKKGWAIGQMGGGFVMVPDWNGVFAKGRGRRRKTKTKKKKKKKRKKRGEVGELSSEKSQGKGTE